MRIFRIGLPVLGTLAGVGLIVFGGEYADGAGVMVLGSVVIAMLLNGLYRYSVGEKAERDAEQAARDHYTQYGRWPDD